MFGFVKKRLLLEHKKILWQNLTAADILHDTLKDNDPISAFCRESLVKSGLDLEKMESQLESILKELGTTLKQWDFKQPFDANTAERLWNINKTLRAMYANYFPATQTPTGESFDDFINPPYGWDIALSDWK